MKTLLLAATLAAFVGCGSGQITQAEAEAAAVKAQMAVASYEKAVADHEKLIRQRDEIEAIQRDLIEKLTLSMEGAPKGPDSDFVRGVHEDIAEEREIQRQYAEEFAAKIEAAEQRVAEAKAALDAMKTGH